MRVRARVRAGMQACRRGRVCVGVGERVHGGGRVSIGVRACLRFDSALNLPIGEREGGLKGCLFAGRVTIAE